MVLYMMPKQCHTLSSRKKPLGGEGDNLDVGMYGMVCKDQLPSALCSFMSFCCMQSIGAWVPRQHAPVIALEKAFPWSFKSEFERERSPSRLNNMQEIRIRINQDQLSSRILRQLRRPEIFIPAEFRASLSLEQRPERPRHAFLPLLVRSVLNTVSIAS